MTSHELIAECRTRGIVLEVVGDRLRCLAPVGVLTPELKQALADQKAPLVQMLAAEAPPRATTSSEVCEVPYQRIWCDYALRDGTYTPEELRQARKVVKPWGPVRTYHLVAVKQYSEPLGRWLLVITEASGEVPPDARWPG